MTFDEFGAECRRTIDQAIRRVRRPDADIDPAYYMYFDVDDGIIEQTFPLRGFYNVRRLVTEITATIVAKTHPVYIGAQFTAWTVPEDIARVQFENLTEEQQQAMRANNDVPDWMMPSKNPARVEIVQLTTLSADDTQIWHRQITRHPRLKPRYGEWAHMYADVDGEITGAMFTPLRQAMSWPDL